MPCACGPARNVPWRVVMITTNAYGTEPTRIRARSAYRGSHLCASEGGNAVRHVMSRIRRIEPLDRRTQPLWIVFLAILALFGCSKEPPMWGACVRHVRVSLGSLSRTILIALATGLTGGWPGAGAAQESTGSSRAVMSATYKSPGKASRLSLLATAIPVAAGIVYWSAQSPERKQEFDAQGHLFADYIEEPNRLVPSVIIGIGLMFGPTAGHLYAGRLGLLPVRVIIAGVATGAAFAVAEGQGDSWSALAAGVAVLGVGGAVAIITSVIDIAKADGAARKYNEEHAATRVGLTPLMLDGGKAAGFAVAASF